MHHRGPPASALHALAERAGILSEYHDMSGERRVTSAETRARLLAAMGLPADDEETAMRTLVALRRRERATPLVPVRVMRVDAADARIVHAGMRDAPDTRVRWSLELAREDGEVRRQQGETTTNHQGSLAVELAEPPPLGYHTLRLAVERDGSVRHGQQRLIVVPRACASPAAVLGGERVAGFTANLYTVRSARNWGAGDLTDLDALVALAAASSAAFVGVNPLHALRNAGHDVSPYSPVSRVFRNALYLDVERVPEWNESLAARAIVATPAFGEALRTARAAERVDYEAVMALKRRVLEALHRDFLARPASAARRAAYAAFRREHGEALDSFATFVTLDERMRAAGSWDWREWPEPLRAPDAPGIDDVRAADETTVDFHRWCQFELDQQLGAVAGRARSLGLPIGLYQDLAIGGSPCGSDVWGDPELYVRGASVGAPPDPLGPEGQNWGLPPWNPIVLRERAYADWTRLVRSALRHAGALRIDHVLGLFRQFWIPDGMAGRDGAYVRFPSEDLMGILALESTRAGALVVGEDLGTVPPEVPPALARWGVLSSKVLYFERGDGGTFKGPRAYPRMALATVNTHDLAPFAGFWTGRDLTLRRSVGQIRTDDELQQARAHRERERAALVHLLVDEGLLDPGMFARGIDAVDEPTVRAAVHALVRRSPSWMVGLSLDDLVGETEPVNLPGVSPEEYPSWTRRLHTPLEGLARDPELRRALGLERAWPTRASGDAAAAVRAAEHDAAG